MTRPRPTVSTLFFSLILLCGWLGSATTVLAGPEPGLAARKDSPGLRLLEDLQTVITDLAEEAKPSVVSIFPVQVPGRSREVAGERNSTGSGSGVIVDPNGHIITNNHVVGDATEVEVRLSDKSKLFAQVIGKDPDTDLAVLKVTADHPLPSARFEPQPAGEPDSDQRDSHPLTIVESAHPLLIDYRSAYEPAECQPKPQR